MKKFNNLSSDAKIVYLLSLCDLIIDNIRETDGYKLAVEAIGKCLEWMQFKNIEADSLYSYLENMDETDVMTYMQLENNTDNERVWICIAAALAYTTREAYRYENEKYMPQTIECVDFETIESFISNFKQLYLNSGIADRLLNYLEAEYRKAAERKPDIDKIKNFIAENVKIIDFYSGFEGEKEIVLFADNMKLNMWDGYFNPVMEAVFYKEVQEYGEAFGIAAGYQTCTGWCDIHAEKTVVGQPEKELAVFESVDIDKELKKYRPDLSEDYKEEIIKVYKVIIDFFKRAEGTIYIEEQ